MEHPLITTLDVKGNYITLKFTGDLGEKEMEMFKKDVADASSIIVDSYRDHSIKVHVLLDMTGFSGTYTLEALMTLTEFAKKNKPFIDKTASFGGSDKVKMAGEIVITLSHRDNIRIFNTKEEATTWLIA